MPILRMHCYLEQMSFSVKLSSNIQRVCNKFFFYYFPQHGCSGNIHECSLITRLKTNANSSVKKKYDKNHVLKNIGKKLYALQAKTKKIGKTVRVHFQKCIKYAFAKHQGDAPGLKENLRWCHTSLGGHSMCKERFCGYQRKKGDKYTHRSLLRKGPLKDTALKQQLEDLFRPVIITSDQYSDLGSSQQCEHANREMIL